MKISSLSLDLFPITFEDISLALVGREKTAVEWLSDFLFPCGSCRSWLMSAFERTLK